METDEAQAMKGRVYPYCPGREMNHTVDALAGEIWSCYPWLGVPLETMYEAAAAFNEWFDRLIELGQIEMWHKTDF
ncbi:MAG TPA: hypothetical protein VMY35_06205 [Phycisphaerae bacterium]|nr:hypothetical protein [Phycisphaerae bacterium]